MNIAIAISGPSIAPVSDSMILLNRRIYSEVLGYPALVAARREIQEAFDLACFEGRCKGRAERAQARRTGLPVEAFESDDLTPAEAEYWRLFNLYHQEMRPTALAGAGYRPELMGAETSTERVAREDRERTALTPPDWWGRKRQARFGYTEEARVAAWMRLKPFERENISRQKPRHDATGRVIGVEVAHA